MILCVRIMMNFTVVIFCRRGPLSVHINVALFVSLPLHVWEGELKRDCCLKPTVAIASQMQFYSKLHGNQWTWFVFDCFVMCHLEHTRIGCEWMNWTHFLCILYLSNNKYWNFNTKLLKIVYFQIFQAFFMNLVI